ncbi:helix-turn-helix domain-containing protein [Pedobacter nutrimenti]|uniref:helix-turn-helix domain-containing protein n=1 Tax=Pedobacter nutrimenti TaxID=1241337 RepID=UPI00105CCCD7|nr:helix-turn-helix domain-containing protein [Pedobacter nutrimenti]
MQTDIERNHTSVFTSGFVPNDVKLVNELQDLIEIYYKTWRSPELYCDRLNISLKRLNRLTRCYFKKSVYQMMQDRLHREAVLLLMHSTLTAKEITFELGVCDPAHFSKCFKQRTGYSPGEFRKMVCSKTSD